MSAEVACRNGVALLMDYMEGTLATGPRHALQAHVAGCVRCQGFLRSYAETPRILREATAERMPARVGRALRRRLAAASPGRPWR